jgi:hypothetical protein
VERMSRPGRAPRFGRVPRPQKRSRSESRSRGGPECRGPVSGGGRRVCGRCPGIKALDEREKLVVSNWVGKLYTDRTTLTPPVLNRAALVTFLVSGADKAPALKAVLEIRPELVGRIVRGWPIPWRWTGLDAPHPPHPPHPRLRDSSAA